IRKRGRRRRGTRCWAARRKNCVTHGSRTRKQLPRGWSRRCPAPRGRLFRKWFRNREHSSSSRLAVLGLGREHPMSIDSRGNRTATVKSREVQRALLAEMAGDRSGARRHFLAAAHLEMVLAEDYATAGAPELAIRS